MTLTPVSLLIIYCSVTAAALGCTVLFSAVLMRRQRTTIQAYALEMASLQGSLQHQVAAAERATRVLEQLLETSEGLDSRLERLELRRGEPSYGRAIARVQHGADAQSLVRDFVLSPAEAELVSVVHARRAS